MSEKEKETLETTADTQETPETPEVKPEAKQGKAKKDEAKPSEPKVPTVVEDKYVTVKSKISGRKFIGAGWLELKKDAEIKVTQDQKRCLLEAGAIYL